MYYSSDYRPGEKFGAGMMGWERSVMTSELNGFQY